MMPFRFVLCGLALNLILGLGGAGEMLAQADGKLTRVFTDSTGRTLEASVDRVKEGFVRLIRKGDGKAFVIEATTLSLEDQAWLRAVTSPSLPETSPAGNEVLRQDFGGGWKRLRIRLPGAKEEPQVMGMALDAAGRRIDGHTHDLILPVGSWVKMSVWTREGNLESVVRYDGESNWVFTHENRVTHLSRDGLAPEIVGISLPLERPEEFINSLDRSKLVKPVSLELRDPWHASVLDGVDFPVHAFLADDIQLTKDDVQKLVRFQPKVLALDLKHETLASLSALPSVEALHVLIREIPRATRGDDKRQAVDSFDLPVLPNLRDLGFNSAAVPPDFITELKQLSPRLRLFLYVVRNANSFPVEWSGVDQFTELESFHIPSSRIRVPAKEVGALKKLRSLSLFDSSVRANDPDLPDMIRRPGLLQFHCAHLSFPDSVWQKWADSGGLSTLIQLETFQSFDLSKLESIELLILRRNKDQNPPRELPFESLGKLKTLKYLAVSRVSTEEMAPLAALENQKQIETLKLNGGTFESVSPLTSYANLKRLIMIGYAGKDADLDLRQFPKLLTFTGEGLRVNTISGVGNHPSLEKVSLQTCTVKALGEASADSRLESVTIIDVGELEDLHAASQAAGLRQLHIYDCPTLLGPSALAEKEGLEALFVRNAGAFPDAGAFTP